MVAREVLDCIINDDVFIHIFFYLQSRVMLELTRHDRVLFLRRTKGEVDLKKKSLRTKISQPKSTTSLSGVVFF